MFIELTRTFSKDKISILAITVLSVSDNSKKIHRNTEQQHTVPITFVKAMIPSARDAYKEYPAQHNDHTVYGVEESYSEVMKLLKDIL